MIDQLTSKIDWIDFERELSDIKIVIQNIKEQIPTNENKINDELQVLSQEITDFEWNDDQKTIKTFENMINSLVWKLDQIEKESNMNFDEYQEKLEFILSSKKELTSLSSSVNNSLNTESGREKVAQIWKKVAAGRVLSDINNLSEKNPLFKIFKFFESRV